VKTHEARTVRLPRSITDELAAHLASQSHGPDDLAFPAPLGGPMRWSKWTRRYFKPAALTVGLPERLRLYDLRHTCASLLIREGANVKAVQAQLGHATASITLDTYGHLFPDELDQLASRLEAARAEALEARQAARVWPQSGPTVVQLSEGAGQ
jgi:integrase